MAGVDVGPILVDITPHSLGVEALHMRDGVPFLHSFSPIIERNTALPATRTEIYSTVNDGQDAAEIRVFQGESDDTRLNDLVGEFHIKGLADVPAPNHVLVRLDLDLNGILRVTATEKRTGLTKQITIEGATTAMSESEMAQARRRMQELFGIEGEEVDFDEDDDEEVIEIEASDLATDASAAEADRDRRVQISEARALLERSRRLLDRMTPEDREEAIALHEQIEDALKTAQWQALHAAMTTLADLLFYVEEG